MEKPSSHRHFKYGIIFIISGIVLLVLSYFLYRMCSGPKICFQDQCFFIQIADTVQERQKGLMFRTSLDENRGMLFVFGNLDIHPFWMKNTLIPLDMVWLDHDLFVVDIKTAVPCETDPCTSYLPTGLSQYVLEINAGIAETLGLKIGDRMILKQ